MKFNLKFLVIRFSSIGDIVLTTSLLKSIKTTYKNVEIHYLTLDKFSSMLEIHPNIDRIIVLNSDSGSTELMQLNRYIKLSEYDKVFDLHGSIRSRIVTLGLSKITTRVKKPRISRFFLYQFHINMFPKKYSTQAMYHQCLQDYDMASIPDTLLVVSKVEKRFARSILKKIEIDSNFIVMVPGAAWPQKQWQVEQYNNVINEINRLTNKKIIMLGTKNDKICKHISLMNDSVVDYSGKTDLRQAMAVISLSDSVFGSDTGLLHIAEALGKHVSMILGPTSTETGGGVSLKESINIETNIWCRPCSQNGKQKCYRTRQYCMELISTDMVTNSVIERA